MYQIVGSQALSNLRIPNLPGHRPRDTDFIADESDTKNLISIWEPEQIVLDSEAGKVRGMDKDGRYKMEIEVAIPGTSAYALLTALESTESAMTLDHLYTLKMSHRFKKDSVHFEKTRADILAMAAVGAKVFNAGWLKWRESETLKKHPKVKGSKGSFFAGDGVTYYYDHDWIHTVVALICSEGQDEKPAYEYYKIPGEEVKCSRDLFDSAGSSIRLRGVVEEAMVLALERALIPALKEGRPIPSPDDAFKLALQRVCTSVTSGWFRQYAWDMYDEVLFAFPNDYWSRFQAGL